jgi:hypothetical protein
MVRGRAPNARIAQVLPCCHVLPCYQVLHGLEQQFSAG